MVCMVKFKTNDALPVVYRNLTQNERKSRLATQNNIKIITSQFGHISN